MFCLSYDDTEFNSKKKEMLVILVMTNKLESNLASFGDSKL